MKKILAICCVMLGIATCTSESSNATNVICSLNARRASIGLYPLVFDARLQQLAERESYLQARRGKMGHINGSPSPARAAGVGYTTYTDPTGRRFQTCYAITRKYRYAGASAVVARNGRTYFTLMLR